MGAASLLVVLIVGLCAAKATAYANEHDAGQAGCDMTRVLRLNDSFTFDHFPPNAGYGHSGGHGYLGYGRGGRGPNPLHVYYKYTPRQRQRGPQECTWTFKAQGDCLLELRTERYERGNVDCDEQYLLIGDENTEKRICGFAKPPRRLNSTGRQLFVTHFKRNAYDESGASVLAGTVRCVKKEPACPAWTNWTCVPFDGLKCVEGSDCTASTTVTTLTTPAGSDSASGLCPASARCDGVRFGICFAGTNATCDAPLPAVTFFEGAIEGQCGSAQVGCPANDPECHFNTLWSVNGFNKSLNGLACSFPPHKRCATALPFCFTFSAPPT